uniref:GB1/RHD3-type G domain-containing protein n=1 Tax=Ananas comosus var. bracteatus TaxID=296719 RepID=A0A6V7PPD1_ANACO|nr:unnamed protein product [Ananas comosus var. bracteatus]
MKTNGRQRMNLLKEAAGRVRMATLEEHCMRRCQGGRRCEGGTAAFTSSVRQTTKGMWLSRCVRPSFLIMDVEGSDGRERGEDDTSFEKQSALFALTISDLMMVTIWLRDIGREQGGSIPLLRTVFRERAKLEPGRTKVLVVIRGYDNEVSVVALPDKIQEQKFKREVAKLREWFAKNSLVGFRQDKVSASDFSFRAKRI